MSQERQGMIDTFPQASSRVRSARRISIPFRRRLVPFFIALARSPLSNGSLITGTSDRDALFVSSSHMCVGRKISILASFAGLLQRTQKLARPLNNFRPRNAGWVSRIAASPSTSPDSLEISSIKDSSLIISFLGMPADEGSR